MTSQFRQSPRLFLNLIISGGPAQARAYFEELLLDVLEVRIEPGRVFVFIGILDKIPEGNPAMDEHKAIKELIEF